MSEQNSGRLYYSPPTCLHCDKPPVCRTADGAVCHDHTVKVMASRIEQLEQRLDELERGRSA